MKNLMLTLFVMTAFAFSTNLQAQTACTPAQMEACKKICGDKAKCTPAQIAACKKACKGAKGTATASAVKASNAVKVVNQAPSKTSNCQKPCAAPKSSAVNSSTIKLVGLDILPETKKKGCSKPCAGKKE